MWFGIQVRIDSCVPRFDTSFTKNSCCHPDSPHVGSQGRMALKEKFVIVTSRIDATVDAGESIQVELTSKAVENIVLKLLRQYFFCESLWLVTSKNKNGKYDYTTK